MKGAAWCQEYGLGSQSCLVMDKTLQLMPSIDLLCLNEPPHGVVIMQWHSLLLWSWKLGFQQLWHPIETDWSAGSAGTLCWDCGQPL